MIVRLAHEMRTGSANLELLLQNVFLVGKLPVEAEELLFLFVERLSE